MSKQESGRKNKITIKELAVSIESEINRKNINSLEIEQCLLIISEYIRDCVLNSGKFEIRGFGSFSLGESKKRDGIVKFRPSGKTVILI